MPILPQLQKATFLLLDSHKSEEWQEFCLQRRDSPSFTRHGTAGRLQSHTRTARGTAAEDGAVPWLCCWPFTGRSSRTRPPFLLGSIHSARCQAQGCPGRGSTLLQTFTQTAFSGWCTPGSRLLQEVSGGITGTARFEPPIATMSFPVLLETFKPATTPRSP